MPSTATARNGLEKQGTGENENTWGTKLNTTGLDLIDEALDGVEAYTLSGSKTLSSTNYAANEARNRVQHITGGTGGTITIPAREKVYHVINESSGDVIFTTGSGATATVPSGVVSAVICNGTNVYLDNSATVANAQAAAEAAVEAAADALAAAEDAVAAAAAVNPSNLVQLTGSQTISGLKTFGAGLIINSQTLDGLTAFGVTMAEAANAAAGRSALGLGTAAVLGEASTANVRAASGTGLVSAEDIANASALVQLTDAASISVDWTSFVNAYVTLGGNRALANPSNVVPGTFRTICVEAASGTRALTFDTNYKGNVPTINDVTSTKSYLVTLYARGASHIVVTAVRAL